MRAILLAFARPPIPAHRRDFFFGPSRLFRCEVCSTVVPPLISCHRLVIAERAVVYPSRKEVHYHPPRDGGRGKWVDDPGGVGREIIREIRTCPSCATAREGPA